MANQDHLSEILDRILKGNQTEADIDQLRRSLKIVEGVLQLVSQDGEFNTNIGQITGGDVHIGDRIYQGADAELIRPLLEELKATGQFAAYKGQKQQSVDELVQQVRSHLHNDIQRLHSTMPLWGVDHWVSLGDLFVDVNILEELSSSCGSELDDLWQDFSKNPSYRSLDRIGLGRERQRVSGLEVLAKNTNLMVVGKPGSGKTTYLQRIVTECNSGNLQAHRIPVLVKLRDFVNYGREFAYSLERYFEQCWQLSNTEINLIFHQGRALVLLDGLDEVTGEDGKNITKQIKQFTRSYPQVQVIVTCRTQSFTGEMDWKSLRFSFVEVADFNETQVRLFAEHWFQAVIGDNSAGLAQAQAFLNQLFLEANQPIQDLAITPILLSLTCVVFHQTGKFYSKRSKLYEEGLELLLEQWDKSREIERDEIYRDLSPERKLKLLSYLAVKKFEQAQYVLFEQEEIEGYIAEFLGIGLRDSRVVLKAIESQHGLLIERSQKVWSFSHLTFQEYFVAQFIFDNLDSSSIFRCWIIHIGKLYWAEVLSLIQGKLNDHKLRILKQQIDYLISNCKSQNFLTWINQKSSAVKVSKNPIFVKLLYFFLAYDQDHVRESHNPFHNFIMSSVDFFDDCIFLNIISLSLVLNRNISSNFASAIALDLIRYTSLGYTVARAENSEFKYEFIKLKERLPELLPLKNNWEDFKQWWKSNGQDWTIQVRITAMKYRNIGNDWLFNNEEQELLQYYYDANIWLLLCLRINHQFSPGVKKEIQETVLLPISEIEKRKCEQPNRAFIS